MWQHCYSSLNTKLAVDRRYCQQRYQKHQHQWRGTSLPKQEVTPARAEDMKFLSPVSDVKGEDSELKVFKRHEFDLRQPPHRVLNTDSVTKLINDIKLSMHQLRSKAALGQRSPTKHFVSRADTLWNNVPREI